MAEVTFGLTAIKHVHSSSRPAVYEVAFVRKTRRIRIDLGNSDVVRLTRVSRLLADGLKNNMQNQDFRINSQSNSIRVELA
jgi:hypothetical protein